jgi:hypothetical protein
MSMQDWIGLCTAAGINVRNMDEMDVYLTAGRILNDRELAAKTLEHCGGGHMYAGARADVLKAMSAQERLAIRERVTGVVQMPVRKTT